MQIDRDELRSECARLVPRGGLLVIVGDNLSGRTEAASIAASFFEDSGLSTHHVLDAGDRPSSIRYILENIAEWAVGEIGATGQGLSIAASNASISLERMSSYCAQVLEILRSQSSPSSLAFVISAIGQSSPADRHEVELLGRLIENVGGCWVVITQDSASWRDLSARIISLRNFTRAEVASEIRSIVQARGGGSSLIQRYMNMIFEGGRNRVRPICAYYYLQQLATSEYGEV